MDYDACPECGVTVRGEMEYTELRSDYFLLHKEHQELLQERELLQRSITTFADSMERQANRFRELGRMNNLLSEKINNNYLSGYLDGVAAKLRSLVLKEVL